MSKRLSQAELYEAVLKRLDEKDAQIEALLRRLDDRPRLNTAENEIADSPLVSKAISDAFTRTNKTAVDPALVDEALRQEREHIIKSGTPALDRRIRQAVENLEVEEARKRKIRRDIARDYD